MPRRQTKRRGPARLDDIRSSAQAKAAHRLHARNRPATAARRSALCAWKVGAAAAGSRACGRVGDDRHIEALDLECNSSTGRDVASIDTAQPKESNAG